MTEAQRTWVPPIPDQEKSDHKERFEEVLKSGYDAVRRARVETDEIRREYRSKIAAVG